MKRSLPGPPWENDSTVTQLQWRGKHWPVGIVTDYVLFFKSQSLMLSHLDPNKWQSTDHEGNVKVEILITWRQDVHTGSVKGLKTRGTESSPQLLEKSVVFISDLEKSKSKVNVECRCSPSREIWFHFFSATFARRCSVPASPCPLTQISALRISFFFFFF